MAKEIIIDPRTLKRDVVLDMLRVTPMLVPEIVMATRYSSSDVGNIMTNLKNKSLIETYHEDKDNYRGHRRWVAVENAPRYSDLVECNIRASIEKAGNSDIIQGAKVVTCNDYHSYSPRSKINAWSGYGSFNFV